MRLILQRVTEATVKVGGDIVGEIDSGVLVLVGVETADEYDDIDWLVSKIINMRIFPDGAGRMNLSAIDSGREFLIISQFTLYASTRKGNRPSFTRSAKPDFAKNIYLDFVDRIRSKTSSKVATGEFGADMKVALVNDGPVTIFMDSRNRE